MDPTNPAGGDDLSADLDTDVIEGVDNDAQDQDLDQNDQDGLDNQQTVEDDHEEVEYEGAQYKVPKAIKGAIMRQADYTQKTQALAADRQTLNGLQSAFAQQVQAHQATSQQRTELAMIDRQISAYTPEALRQLAIERPEDLPLAQLELQQLERQRATLAGEIGQKEAQALELQRQQAATQAQHATAILQRDIKGWNDQVYGEVLSFGQTLGFTQAEVNAVMDPRVVKVLHELMGHRKAQQQQQRTQRVQQQQRTAPAASISQRGPAGRIQAAPDTNDFGAFERLADQRMGRR